MRLRELARYGTYLLVSVALALPLVTLSCGPGAVKTGLGQEFPLSIGQSAEIAGEDLEIKFLEVLEDSRCPKGAVCIWAGRVSCLLQITRKGSSEKTVLTEPGLTDENSGETYQEYRFTFRVAPYPELGKTISKSEYRLLLIVERSKAAVRW